MSNKNDKVYITISKSEHDVLTVPQAATETGLSERVLLDALRSEAPNSLKGRNMRGQKGWITTRGALTEWIESGNSADFMSEHEEPAAV